jgi:hypothetical protein
MMAVTFSYAGSRQVRRDAFYVENEPLTKEDRFSKASQNIKHSPRKIRNTATPMYFKAYGVAATFCPTSPRRNETRKKGVAFVLRRSWRRVCNATAHEWHSLQGNVAAWRQFFGVSREDNCDVFEKSFCGAINIGGECFAEFFSADKIHRQTHNP